MPCAEPTLCDPSWSPAEKQCAATHVKSPDPQFTGNSSIANWRTQVNHEIGLQVPASCMGEWRSIAKGFCYLTRP